jgi:hypothetical protein
MVEDELFTPLLGYVSLMSVLQGYERQFGASTMKVEARLVLGGGREVHVQDVLAGQQPAEAAAAVLAGPLALLFGNDFEKVSVDRMQVAIDAEEEERTAEITRVWVDAPEPLRPGTSTKVKVQLRTRRGESLLRELPFSIPATAPNGTYTLLVSDAGTMDAVERREMRQAFTPRDLPQLVRALNRLRASSRLYARLTRPGAGAVLGGEYMPSLPGSVLSVLTSNEQGSSVVALQSTPVWSAEQATDHAVSGYRQINLSVQR